TAQSPGGRPPEGAAPEPAELGREKQRKYTRIQVPLALMTRPPGAAAELPDIVVSRSWAGDWMLQLQRLST
ncbi:hypothetical protein A6R68_23896, partial [Neotoma lepida]